MKRVLTLAVLLTLCVTTAWATDDDGAINPGSGIGIMSGELSNVRAPGQLTTLFAQNNGFQGNMFDLEPAIDLSEITALDVNVDPAGETAIVDVWYRMDTCVGHDLDPTGWSMLGSGSGTAAGIDLPTFINLSGNGVSFAAGGTYGIYVDVTSYPSPGINYTNAPSATTYSNADVSATCYYGKGDPTFTGSTFTYRMWNGTIYYEAGPPLPLTVTPKNVSAWLGGQLDFALNGGIDNAGKKYALLATFSGDTPGTNLPGGLVLPLNWDWFTDFLLGMALNGSPLVIDFLGNLDVDGNATAALIFPGHCQLYQDLFMHFAFCTYGPFDFVSNSQMVTVTGAPPPPDGYQYDDGEADNGLGLTAGGQMCWLQHFQKYSGGETLATIKTAWGYPGGSYPPAGTAGAVYVWDDPTNDGDPTDCSLLATVATTVQDPGTNMFTEVTLPGGTTIAGTFFIGAMSNQAAGQYPGPMDETTPYGGEAWVVGDTTSNFDPNNLTNNDVAPVELSTIGFPAYWLLRATVP